MSEHTAEIDAGCPTCGGDNLAAMGRQVWCNECDWIDPPGRVETWNDGDAITHTSRDETWTRVEGRWWSDLGGEPKTDEHATNTLECFHDLVTVRRAIPPEASAS